MEKIKMIRLVCGALIVGGFFLPWLDMGEMMSELAAIAGGEVSTAFNGYQLALGGEGVPGGKSGFPLLWAVPFLGMLVALINSRVILFILPILAIGIMILFAPVPSSTGGDAGMTGWAFGKILSLLGLIAIIFTGFTGGSNTQTPMSIPRYFLFLCGQIGIMSLSRFLYQWILKYGDLDDSGTKLFPAITLGIVFFAFRVFDGITDPIAGKLTDSWVRKGFQRRTLLWTSFALAPIGLTLTFLANHSHSKPFAWALLTIGLLIFFVGYTFYAIPYWSLIDDYAEGNMKVRAKLSNLLGLGIVLASGIGFVASGALIEKFSALDEPDPLGYSMAALSFGGVSVFLMILPFFARPKRTNKTIKTANPPEIQTEKSSLWSGIALALKHRRFLALIALFGGSQMSFTVMTTAAPFIATELLGGSLGDVAQLLGPLLGMAVICFLFVPKIQQRFGWLRSMLYASIALSIVYACCGLLGKSLIVSPLMTASVVFGLGGPMIAVLLGVEAEGVVDCAKETAGESLVGIYWGAFNFVVKILNGIAILLASILIYYQEIWGNLAIRSMGFLAGGCLLSGVGFYYMIRPSEKNKTPEI
jgi:Na+/melibiose symporter-like transporter